jgi:hypothetical protein
MDIGAVDGESCRGARTGAGAVVAGEHADDAVGYRFRLRLSHKSRRSALV